MRNISNIALLVGSISLLFYYLYSPSSLYTKRASLVKLNISKWASFKVARQPNESAPSVERIDPSAVLLTASEDDEPKGQMDGGADTAAPGCEDVWTVPESNRCAHVRERCDGQDAEKYLALYFCDMLENPNIPGFVVFLLYLLVLAFCIFLLFNALASTADVALSPSLQKMTDHLGISPAVAGATFLALGNGAPDVFAGLSAAQDPSTIFIGVGALIGGASFVSQVVAAAVAVSAPPGKPVRVQAKVFMRDCGFLFVSVALMLLFAVRDTVGLWEAFLFFGLYVIYVVFIVVFEKQTQRAVAAESSLRTGSGQEEEETAGSTLDKHLVAPGTSDTEAPTTAETHSAEPDHYTAMGDEESPSALKTGRTFTWHMKRATDRFKSVWSTARMKASLQRRLEKLEWEDMSTIERVRFIVLSPYILVRWLTTPDCETWDKTQAAILPSGIALFLMFMSETLESEVGGVPIAFLVLIPTSILGVFILYATQREEGPEWLTNAYGYAAFVISVLWINTVAGELVAQLAALSIVLSLPSILVGLTLLSWGNSIADLVANVAISKAGNSEMGITGCFAGPNFNILFGFGASMLRATWENGSNIPFTLLTKSQASSIVFILGLLTALPSLVFLVWRDRWTISVRTAYIQLGVYATSLCVSIVLAFMWGSETA